MTLERLIKEGWFDGPEEIDLDLSEEEVDKVKNGEVVVVRKENKNYAVYLASYFDPSNLKLEDVIIREF